MKDLIQYHYACMDAINLYMQGIYRRSQLISKLREIENHHRKETDDYENEKQLWFRFFEGDNLVTTITEIDNCLLLPQTHPNFQSMIESFEIAITDASLQVYFS